MRQHWKEKKKNAQKRWATTNTSCRWSDSQVAMLVDFHDCTAAEGVMMVKVFIMFVGILAKVEIVGIMARFLIQVNFYHN